MNAYRLMKTLAVFALVASSVHAIPTDTPRTRIKIVEVGWSEPNIRLFVDGPVLNPDNCPDPHSYIIAADLPSRDAMLSMALTAYSMNEEVNFIVDGCTYGSPRVITMRLRKE